MEFACRKYGEAGYAEGMGSEMVFNDGDFNKQKVALEKGEGLKRCEASLLHKNTTKM